VSRTQSVGTSRPHVPQLLQSCHTVATFFCYTVTIESAGALHLPRSTASLAVLVRRT